jgi:hypothetical protein
LYIIKIQQNSFRTIFSGTTIFRVQRRTRKGFLPSFWEKQGGIGRI